MADESKPQTTTTNNASPPITELPAGGGVVAAGGGVTLPATGTTGLVPPAGGVILGVDTDVTDLLKAGEPTFGKVLSAMGSCAAETQTALNKAVVNAIQELNKTKIDVPRLVEIELNDDGVPFGDEAHTKVITSNVSLAQYYLPSYPRLARLDTSIDLVVGSFHQSHGVQFNANQSNTSIGGGISWSKGWSGWFGGSYSNSQQNVNVNVQNDVEFVSGQLLVDAEFTTTSIAAPPAIAQITVGPRVLIVQGKITETKVNNVVSKREVTLDVQVRMANGNVNPGVGLVLEAPGLLGGGGKTTDGDGKVSFPLARDLPPGTTGFRQFHLTFVLTDLRTPYTLTL